MRKSTQLRERFIMSAKTHCDGKNCNKVMQNTSDEWYQLRVYKNEGEATAYFYKQKATLDLCPDCYAELFGIDESE